ncbi:MAG: protein-glutamate O-methyltransferase CheR [Nitrospinae bacterium]|nr:protein-glutamate O-methyltransferase CheR [Nitrospinota bacterium]
MAISAPDFDFIRKLIHERSAIVIEPGKEYLVEARLQPLAQREGFPSIQELVAKLRSDRFNCLHQKVVDAMTTNETSFFRDVHPFETMRKIIVPEIMAKRAGLRELNVWCGASSSGQEPYTIAMLLRENFPELAKWKVVFMASDISQEMLTRSRNGMYSQLEINRGLPAAYLVKYFQRVGMEWQIKEDLRKTIDFREINLCGAWPHIPKLDIIFMRNVLIYFDVNTKKTILGKIRQLLKPDGYLFLGAAETTLNLDDNFTRMNFPQSGCYRLKDN